jgi:H+/Cl- antiporter ClcA
MNKMLYFFKLTLVAVIIGAFISLYQYLIHLVVDLSITLLTGKFNVFILTIFTVLLLYLVILFINKKNPGYYGSGIPQIEAYYDHKILISSAKMFILIFINSLHAFFSNLLLGSEGTSVSIGTSIGLIENKIFKDEDNYNGIYGGSSAFGCAFLSPLAGMCHLFEENIKTINFKKFIKGCYVIVLSFLVMYLLYPHKLLPVFESIHLPLKFYYILIFIVIFGILTAKFFIWLNVKIKSITKKNKSMAYVTPCLIIICMVLVRFYNVSVGSGSRILTANLLSGSLITLILLFLFRLLFTSLSLSAYTSGGLVLPTLAIGCLASLIIVKIVSIFNPTILDYQYIFVICGMFTTFSIVTKCPLTGFVLAMQCMDVKVIILPVIVTIVICYVMMKVFKYDNIYHQLVHAMGFK